MQSREFYTSNNTKKSKEEINQLTEEAFALLKQKEVSDEAERREFQESLEKINFSDLHQLFKDDLSKSGVDEDFQFINKERILNIPSNQANIEASYLAVSHSIILDFSRLKNKADQFGVPRELYLLYILAHEETHAVSKVDCHGIGETSSDNNPVAHVKYGYAQDTVTTLQGKDGVEYFHKDSFLGLEEGLTEKIGREEIFEKYVSENPEFATREDIEKLKKIVSTHDLVYYNAELKMVNALLRALGRSTALDEATVWQAIKQGKFSGNNFINFTNHQSLEKALGPEIAHLIENLDADSPEQALAIANRLDASDPKNIPPFNPSINR